MTAGSLLNAVELAEESTAGPVNRTPWPTSTLVRDEIADGARYAAAGLADEIEASARRP